MKNKKYLSLISIIWFFPVLMFVLNPQYNNPAWPTWLSAFATLFVCLLDHRFFSLSLPFWALLSPLALSTKIFNFLPSELYVLGCFLFGLIVLLLKGTKEFQIRKGESFLVGLFILSIISYLLSFEHKALFKAMISWVMLFTVFILTKKTLKSDEDHIIFFKIIIISVCYTSFISLVSYLNGISLNIFIDPNDFSKEVLIVDQLSYYFRVTTFYANSGYIIGSAAIISFILIFSSSKILNKLFYIIIYLFLFLILILMQEKSGLLALIIISILIVFSLKSYLIVGLKKNKNFLFPIIFTTIIVSINYFFKQALLLSNYQISGASFSARLCVWMNTFDVLIENPLRLLFGFGPDSSITLKNEYTISAKESCSGSIEGAIDGGHITLLFEYGIFFILLFWSFNLSTLYRIFRNLKHSVNKTPYLIIFPVILFINIIAIGDPMGLSKVTWIIVQIFSISCFYLSRAETIKV